MNTIKKIRVRELSEDDLPEVRIIFQEFVQLHVQYDTIFEKIDDADQIWSAYIHQSQAEDNDYRVLVAELDGQVVGYCLGYISDKPPIYKDKRIGEVGNIAVRQGYKRQGIGKLLFEEIKSWFLEQGVHHIETDVASNNPQSMGFWKHVGGRGFITRMAIKL